jgi:hypothetical protein
MLEIVPIAGLTHKQSYKDIFAITIIKTAVFVIIGAYYATRIV